MEMFMVLVLLNYNNPECTSGHMYLVVSAGLGLEWVGHRPAQLQRDMRLQLLIHFIFTSKPYQLDCTLRESVCLLHMQNTCTFNTQCFV